MNGPRILIVYGSRYGQTAKVARHVADTLDSLGAGATVLAVETVPSGLALREFDGVAIGSPVYFGRHLRAVRRFVARHRDALNAMPTAFFSVSGTAARDGEPNRSEAGHTANDFLTKTGWQPALTREFGGAMKFTRYNPILRRVMARIARKQGGPSDTSRDHELTDWARVDRFTGDLLDLVAHAHSPRADWRGRGEQAVDRDHRVSAPPVAHDA